MTNPQELAAKVRAGVDSDGHCRRCGLRDEADVTHECPPGFMIRAERYKDLLAEAVEGLGAIQNAWIRGWLRRVAEAAEGGENE